jgi:hypothetical protein
MVKVTFGLVFLRVPQFSRANINPYPANVENRVSS